MDFLNLAAEAGYTVQGNPDLRPENSTNVTVGLEWRRESVHIRSSAFPNDFDDFIETRVERGRSPHVR